MTDVARIRPGIGASIAPRDRGIAELASRQHGVVAYWQLLRLGFGRRSIQHRVEAGRLHRVEFGVYAVGHKVLTWHGRCLAAVLSYGPGAVLSHRPAIGMWELRPSASPVIHVTVARRGCRARNGIRLHGVRHLHPGDVKVLNAIPITSVARTLLDFAESGRKWELERALEEAERRGLFDLNEIDEVIERNPGRPGVKPLRAVLAEFTEAPPIRSDFERDFLHFCKELGLTLPSMNVVVAGYEVDCFWPAERLVVELDSRTHHERRAAFESDRIRDTDLHLANYPPVRITRRRFYKQRDAVAADLRGFLRAAA